MGSLREECGVFGIFSPEKQDLAAKAYYGLFALQHRGQESCGIVVGDDGLFRAYKDTGLVGEVFTPTVLSSLEQGNMVVGHVRYGTTGGNDRANAQPIVVNHIKGRMALAHNGNITNSAELRKELELCGSIFHTTSDTEVISYIITKERLTAPSIEQAVNKAMERIHGAYSLVIMSPSKLIAARDRHGFRPLCYGQMGDGSYVVASESCALDAIGAHFIRDIQPGPSSPCASLNTSTLPGPTLSLRAAPSTPPGSVPVRTWHWSTRFRPTLWWASPIPALTPPWALPASPAFPTAWA